MKIMFQPAYSSKNSYSTRDNQYPPASFASKADVIAFKGDATKKITNPVLIKLSEALSSDKCRELVPKIKLCASFAHVAPDTIDGQSLVETLGLVQQFLEHLNYAEWSEKLFRNTTNMTDAISPEEREILKKIGEKVPCGGNINHPDKKDFIKEAFLNLNGVMELSQTTERREGMLFCIQQVAGRVKEIEELLGVEGLEHLPYDAMITK